MTASKEGKLVDVHHIWKHEAYDFTPWLADNLDLLGEELSLNLKLVSRETPVGRFSLDILARDDDRGVSVAIENQLEPTDHTHLGQLLVYAAGLKAGVAIWVAPEFGYQHAEALHELNRWTTGAIRFFAVKVEAVQSADGLQPEPRLRKVVCPDGWNKELTGPKDGEESFDVKQHRRFFEPLIDTLLRSGFSRRRPIQRFDHAGRHFPSPLIPGIWYSAQLEKPNSAWVNLHIETDNKPQTKHIFDTLLQHRKQIEAAIPSDPALAWDWRRCNHLSFSTINIRTDGSILDSEDKLVDTREWMLALLPKLQDEFDPRIGEILNMTASQEKAGLPTPVF